ncbi:hypothetical protein, partial [Escherichia coli]|uniref:hypothetical protein n=3 Tax=Escherichia coli TaxID=562 RepID=UPI001BC8C372
RSGKEAKHSNKNDTPESRPDAFLTRSGTIWQPPGTTHRHIPIDGPRHTCASRSCSSCQDRARSRSRRACLSCSSLICCS